MTSSQRRLIRHLIVIATLKLVALGVIWTIFVRDARVPVSEDSAAGHVLNSSGEAR
jgi:hypothetical protein